MSESPFRNPYHPDAEERKKWERYRQSLKEKAASGLGVAEAAQIIRSDQWGWAPDFYAKAVRW